MSGYFIVITGLVYLYISIEQMTAGNFGMGLAYAGYAFSNIGVYMLASKGDSK